MFGSEPPWKTSGVKALVSASEQPAAPHKGSLSHLLPTVKGKKPACITLRRMEILVWRHQCQTFAISFLATGRRALGSVLSSPWQPDKFEARHFWAVTSHSAAPGVTVFGNAWPISGVVCMRSDAWDNVGPPVKQVSPHALFPATLPRSWWWGCLLPHRPFFVHRF